jgi:hypothetical protein
MTEEFTLFVPPCGLSHEINQLLKLYYCPERRAIRNAGYLGIYKDRAVRAIGRIAKVVRCRVDIGSKSVIVLDANQKLTLDEQKRIVEAAIEAKERNWDITSGHKFYLCDSMEDTEFAKNSSYGIRGHRMFNLDSLLGGSVPKNLKGIADSLRKAHWS